MARGRPKTFDEGAALDAAITALWREGVRGISLNQLSERTGAPKPALARAFGSKDALTARALARYYEQASAVPLSALQKKGSPRTVAERYLRAFIDAFTDEGTPPGCLLASSVSDCASLTEGPVRDTIDRLSRHGFDAVRDRFAELGIEGAEGFAAFLTGQTVALSTMARNGASRSDLEAFVEIAVRAVPD